MVNLQMHVKYNTKPIASLGETYTCCFFDGEFCSLANNVIINNDQNYLVCDSPERNEIKSKMIGGMGKATFRVPLADHHRPDPINSDLIDDVKSPIGHISYGSCRQEKVLYDPLNSRCHLLPRDNCPIKSHDTK